MAAKIVKHRIPDAVLAEIQRMITSGELKEGDKLPNQNDFAAQLGVSRPSLREALQTLTQLGAIEQRPGVGTILVARSRAFLAGSQALPLISDAEATAQLVEARRIVELGMISLAATRISDQELEELGQVLADMETAAAQTNIEEYCTKDLVYHHLIAKAAHNTFISSIFQNIRQPFEQFLQDTFRAMPDRLQRSLNEHRKVYKALKARDPELAEAAMDSHIAMVEETMEFYYAQRETQDL